jgi:hypothetical protein
MNGSMKFIYLLCLGIGLLLSPSAEEEDMLLPHP